MKRIGILCLTVALFLCSVVSCSKNERHTESFYLMDTVITVTLYTPNKTLATEQLQACRTLLAELDVLWSRHRKESDISRLNASETGEVPLDPRTCSLLRQAQEISSKVGGAFDVTLAPLTDLWQVCGAENRLPTEAELASRLSLTGSERFSLSDQAVSKPKGMQFDLGGIGKGAAISCLLDMLKTSGVSGGLVSFGSNVAVFGSKPDGSPFRVALRDPKDANATVGTLELASGSILSVSGDYERFVTIQGEKYHHILNPATGYPSASGLSSVAVICSDGALADALSTAFLVMGADAAMECYRSGVYEFEAVFVSSNGTVLTTPQASQLFQ